MSSSKLKKPPARRQKRTPEELINSEHDLSMLRAFKKMKVNADGSCIKKTENKAEENLKHKLESTTTPEDSNETDICADWNRSLKNFCLCDEGVLTKRGRSKWKSMCRFHQLRMRKDTSNYEHSLNLARVVRAHKPLIQESRFQSPDNHISPHSVLRLSRFTFEMKSAKVKDGKGNEPSFSATVTKESKSSESTGCDKNKGSAVAAVSERTIFAKGASQTLKDFSSLVPRKNDDESAADKNKVEPVPCFDNFRDGCDKPRRREESKAEAAACSEENVQEASLDQEAEASGAAAASGVSHRTAELTMERSCSQEARLDEMDCSVNDLAGYMEHYFFIPRNMSSMAQMMYA